MRLVAQLRAGGRTGPGEIQQALARGSAALIECQAPGSRGGEEAAADDVAARLRAAMTELRELNRSDRSLPRWAEHGFVLPRDQDRRKPD